ncbi:hypothetical protein KA405_04610 [Patescibacteria group bacterium]|nr:hypothetical protein [Patescibacteria group bacterium]
MFHNVARNAFVFSSDPFAGKSFFPCFAASLIALSQVIYDIHGTHFTSLLSILDHCTNQYSRSVGHSTDNLPIPLIPNSGKSIFPSGLRTIFPFDASSSFLASHDRGHHNTSAVSSALSSFSDAIVFFKRS